MSLARVITEIGEGRCPNGCGPLEDLAQISRCPVCHYHTNFRHIKDVLETELHKTLEAPASSCAPRPAHDRPLDDGEKDDA